MSNQNDNYIKNLWATAINSGPQKTSELANVIKEHLASPERLKNIENNYYYNNCNYSNYNNNNNNKVSSNFQCSPGSGAVNAPPAYGSVPMASGGFPFLIG